MSELTSTQRLLLRGLVERGMKLYLSPRSIYKPNSSYELYTAGGFLVRRVQEKTIRTLEDLGYVRYDPQGERITPTADGAEAVRRFGIDG